MMPFLMQKNRSALKDLKKLQAEHQFDLWLVHNVFPSLSVAVYELAAELGVKVIQYLHNYRFGCANAAYFRKGTACKECRPGSWMPAIKNRCWRGSLPATISMVAALKRFWKSGGMEHIHAYVALSETHKKRHIEMGIPKELIHVHHHHLDIQECQNTSPPTSSGDVLFMGRLSAEKGLRLLIESWAKVNARGRKLRIAGKGEMLSELEELVQEEEIEGVVFEGFVSKESQTELLAKTAFFVAPSVLEEPFGLVVLEAWAQSRPVLATQLGSFPDLINHGVNGWLAKANVSCFSEALQQALDTADQYQEMGEAGKMKLKTEFNSEKWLSRWESLAEEVCNK